MGRLSWIHLIFSKTDYENFLKFTQKEEFKHKYTILGGVVFKGKLRLDEYLGGTFGARGKNSLALLTQSDGSWIIEDLTSHKVIKDPYQVCLLENLDASELEITPNGAVIKKAKYLSEEDFIWYLDELELNDEFNNERYQQVEELKSIGHQFMCSVSKIIIEIDGYQQELRNMILIDLFNNANHLFMGLGSWVYGGANPQIIYPLLNELLSFANSIELEEFEYFVKYISYIGKDLLEFLKDQGWIDSKYHEEPAVKKVKYNSRMMMVMCSIGAAIDSFFMTFRLKDIPLPFELIRTLVHVFDTFGEWLFASGDRSEVKGILSDFQKALKYEYNKEFDDAILEAKHSYQNMVKLFKE